MIEDYKDFEEVMDRVVTNVSAMMDSISDIIIDDIYKIYSERYNPPPPKKYIKTAFFLWCLKAGNDFGEKNAEKLKQLNAERFDA